MRVLSVGLVLLAACGGESAPTFDAASDAAASTVDVAVERLGDGAALCGVERCAPPYTCISLPSGFSACCYETFHDASRSFVLSCQSGEAGAEAIADGRAPM